MNQPTFNLDTLMGTASDILERAGYRRRDAVDVPGSTESTLFEDPYGVVLASGYDSWTSLLETWTEAQGVLVEIMSQYLTASEPKAWDGYLVLLTPSALDPELESKINEVRADTTRVRKLVPVSGQLRDATDVERVLLPLLPLAMEMEKLNDATAVDLLPELLARKDIDPVHTRLLINAMANQDPLVQTLHVELNKP
ncbi:MAG: hypothetical protein JF886_04120 [Candidatus Dormibacteraeota bacterium]|uniref:Uncharacterized protein n=1 Tax=Candidatus Aeolococcus gillhamiae TaxID=3127015 RepID=A0A934JU85_9BACT|nr:hypothetical protein [Candidatus Dormibacteraeota bacterium]